MLTSTTARLASLIVRCICATVLSLTLASVLHAQSSLPAGARTYQLRHREAADVAPQLRKMLSGIGGASSVYVDQELNRLVVQGPAQAQQIASELVGALDQPTDVQPARQPATVARAYRTATRDPREVAQELKRLFPEARIEADLRTGQVVALAPEATQQRIAQLLGGANSRTAAPVGPQSATQAAGYQLRNITWRDFETQLRQMWGQRLALSTTPTGEVSTVIVSTATGPRTVMQIDRRTNTLQFEGNGREAYTWEQVARGIDIPRGSSEEAQLVSVRDADPAKVQRAVALVQGTSPILNALGDEGQATATVQLGGNRARWGGDLAANMFQPQAQAPNDQALAADGQQPAGPAAEGELAVDDAAEGSGLIGPVQIEFLEGMDAIMIRGHKRDVARVRKIIEDIERLSKATQPLIHVYPLQFVNSEAVATLVTELYEEILAPRQGQVSIRALVEPNAILLIGREDSVKVVSDLIAKLDRPVSPSSQFEVIRLKHISAPDAETAVRNFFVNRPGQDTEQRPGLGTRVQVIADYRTNTLIVQASPRDLGEVKRLIETIDTEDSAATAQVRVFKLKNSMAEELAEVLQAAIAGDATQQAQQGQQQGGATQAGSRLPSIGLEFMMLDQAGGRLLRSGVVADVQVSADANTNALIVRAPAKSMELIEALIMELDQMPDAEAKLKVFTIANGDATSLAATLQGVFGQDVTIGQGTGGALGIAFRQPQVQQTTAGGETSLIPLTFAVDVRTNSVIVSGSSSDLVVVETLLLRLDEEGFTTREIIVYRLKNNDAISVSNAIAQYIQGQANTLNQTVLNGGVSTTLDQLLLQVSVIPEEISNSVIVAASPRYLESIMNAIRDLDVRPPMVLVQCLIAEVTLGDVHEFGVELGLQDDLLWDRGTGTGGATPGFNFNDVGLPNVSDFARATVGTQGLADLGLGRTAALGTGPGGLVLSAASDSINVLVRALEEEGRLQVLSRPQVMALNNQPAFVQVGRDVARFNGSTATNTGVTQDVVDVPTGLILSIQPRINDDGVVVMTVDADKSDLGSAADGTVLSDGAGGTFIVPPINRTTAQTTISAKSGQTVVIGGLITKRDEVRSTGVPYLRDIPIAGNLFNFEARETVRTELLIILTPYIVSEDEDYEMIKMMESERMNWCLGDVVSLDGERGLMGAGCMFCANDVPVLFPDEDPSGSLFAAGQHEHTHETVAPTPISLPNDQAHGLQRSRYGQQPNLEPLPREALNAGINQSGQPSYQNDSRYGATPAGYVPNQQPPTRKKPSWFPFSGN